MNELMLWKREGHTLYRSAVKQGEREKERVGWGAVCGGVGGERKTGEGGERREREG